MNYYPARREPSGTTEGWTDARIERLKELWGDGLSASQIAAELGGVSRSAVIGKVHRLGLSGRTKVSAAPRPPREPRRRQLAAPAGTSRPGALALRSGLAFLQTAAPSPEAHEPAAIAADPEIPLAQRRTLLELTAETCRWPIGDPRQQGFFFCGGPAAAGPYCTHHARCAGNGYGSVRLGRMATAA